MNAGDFSDDPLKSMTSTAERIPASPQLRDAVLSRTTRTIRNRRRLRRGAIVAALIGCYLGGIATGSLRHRTEIREIGAGTVARKLVRPEDDQIADDAAQSASKRITQYDRLR